MRQLASALKKLDPPSSQQPVPTGPHFARFGPIHQRLEEALNPAAAPPPHRHLVEGHDSDAAAGYRTTLRIDERDVTVKPHYRDSHQIVLPAAGESLLEPLPGSTGIGPLRYRHQYQQILAQLRRRCTSVKSSTVVLLGVSETSATADLAKDLTSALLQQGESPLLLVDANLSDRSLSHAHGLQEQQGFSDLLEGWPWNELLTWTVAAQLAFLPAGSGFVQRMKGPAWGGLMDEWRDAFRWVIVDGGPATGWLAELLCTACDEVILHSDFEEASSAALRTAVKRIRRQGGRLVGSILTGHEWRAAY